MIASEKNVFSMLPSTEGTLFKVDHDSPLPLYSQMREGLLALLKEGQFEEGDSFPTERELVQKYGVSRITVRRALDELVREGYLIAR